MKALMSRVVIAVSILFAAPVAANAQQSMTVGPWKVISVSGNRGCHVQQIKNETLIDFGYNPKGDYSTIMMFDPQWNNSVGTMDVTLGFLNPTTKDVDIVHQDATVDAPAMMTIEAQGAALLDKLKAGGGVVLAWNGNVQGTFDLDDSAIGFDLLAKCIATNM